MSKDQLNAILRQNFPLFFHRSFTVLNPGVEFLDAPYIHAMCHALERCRRGEIRRLIINVPPRSGKSQCCSVAFPAYLMGHDPSARIITASYGSELAEELANQSRILMQQPFYQSVFPHTRLSSDKNTAMHFRTTRHGSRFSTSVGSAITGFGAQVIIVDDPVKAAVDVSEATLQNAIDWFQSSVITRLDNPATGVIILVMQRLHENDLAGYLLEQGGWELLNLPARMEAPQTVRIGDGKIYDYKQNELLHPQRLSKETLENLCSTLGSYHFAAQYQQRPAPAGGGIVKTEWLRDYTLPPKLKKTGFVVQSWDTANSIKEHACYSVCITAECRGDEMYILNVFRARLEYPELIKRVYAQAQAWHADLILVERTPGSMPLIQAVHREGKINLKSVNPSKGDKQTRMMAETAILEAGQVYAPKHMSWWPALDRELLQFPKGKYDDQVDAFSQLLKWKREYGPTHPNSQPGPTSRITLCGRSRYRDPDINDLLNIRPY